MSPPCAQEQTDCWPHFVELQAPSIQRWCHLSSLMKRVYGSHPQMEPKCSFLNTLLVILLPPTAACCEKDESKMRWLLSLMEVMSLLKFTCQAWKYEVHLGIWETLATHYVNILPKPSTRFHSVESLSGGFSLPFPLSHLPPLAASSKSQRGCNSPSWWGATKSTGW